MAIQSWHTHGKEMNLSVWFMRSIRVKQTVSGGGWLCSIAPCQESTIGGSCSIPLHWFLQTDPSLCASSGRKCLYVCAVRCRQRGCSQWRKTLESPSLKSSKKKTNCPTKYLAGLRLKTPVVTVVRPLTFRQKWKTLCSNHSCDK